LTVLLADVFGSPNIGVYCFCNDKAVAVPPGLTNRKMSKISKVLDVPVCQTTVAGSALLGALLTGNSNGILAPHTIRDHEINALEKFNRVTVVESKWTALGNLVLMNDKGAAIHPDAPKELAENVKDELSVEPVQARIGTLPFVGALGIATNHGAILSPNTLREEHEIIEKTLGVNTDLSTTNGGVPFVRSGIIANSNGAVVGPLTRGGELMQISRILRV